MSQMAITLLTAAISGLINLWLAMRCGKARMSSEVLIGDGGDDTLIKRMRAQANFIEYTPLVLIMMGLVEYNVGSEIWLWVIAAIYVIGRILHPLGMEKANHNIERGIGTMFSMLSTLVLSISALLVAFGIIS